MCKCLYVYKLALHTEGLRCQIPSQVLPRYGFDKGQAGVLQMLSVGARYNDNEEFCSNRALLNESRNEGWLHEGLL